MFTFHLCYTCSNIHLHKIFKVDLSVFLSCLQFKTWAIMALIRQLKMDTTRKDIEKLTVMGHIDSKRDIGGNKPLT